MQDNQLIRAGQWWRLITPVVLHANLMHLVTNNYSLNSLGPAVEMLSGRPRFLTVYAASAVAGSAASFAFSPAASVGASGAPTACVKHCAAFGLLLPVDS